MATRAELPALADLGERAQLLVVWLVSLRSARTRRAYFGDVAAWLAWLDERELDLLTVGRAHVGPRPHRCRARNLPLSASAVKTLDTQLEACGLTPIPIAQHQGGVR